MRIFFWKSSNSNLASENSSKLRGLSYDAAIASTPPVKGSYPVAGNGLSLDDFQRTKERRTSTAGSAAPAPNIARKREERPRTAPHTGAPGGGYTSATDGQNGTSGRTFSGFSMASPPSFFSKRNSISSVKSGRSRRESYLPRAESPPPLPLSTKIVQFIAPIEPVKAYQPTTGTPRREGLAGIHTPSRRTSIVSPSRDMAWPPPPQPLPPVGKHFPAESEASFRSHVDILDAYSTMKHTQKTWKQRREAIGLRIYGEDVADRNIKDFGDPQLDFSGPEFGYLKHVYSPTGRPTRGLDPRADSALGHVLGDDQNGEDTPPQSQSHPKTTSLRSSTGPRPVVTYPVRTSSASSNHSNRHETRGDRSSAVPDGRQRALSPLSSSLSVSRIDEESQIRYHRSGITSILEWVDGDRTSSIHTRPPVSFTSHMATSSPNGQPSRSVLKTRRRTMSGESAASAGNGDSSSRRSSVGFTGLSESRVPHSASMQNSSAKRRENAVVDGDVVIATTAPSKYPHSMKSRNSSISCASSFAAPFISPLHFTTPHDIVELPSFLPQSWPLLSSASRLSLQSTHTTRRN